MVLILAFCLSGCATGTPVQRAVSSASGVVGDAIRGASDEMYSKPMMLEVRRNRCECDEALDFEVRMRGLWRHVFIDGPDVEALREEAVHHENGVFEFPFKCMEEVYVSKNGQKFYILHPIVLKQ